MDKLTEESLQTAEKSLASINSSAKIPELPPQRKRFADAVLAGKTLTQASIEAGYSKKTAAFQGSFLLKQTKIKDYVDFHQLELAKINEIKLDEIVFGIRDVISKCKTDNNYNAVQLLKAYELLAKMGGFLRDQGVNPDSRPAFVGISINMGDGTVKMVKKAEQALSQAEQALSQLELKTNRPKTLPKLSNYKESDRTNVGRVSS